MAQQLSHHESFTLTCHSSGAHVQCSCIVYSNFALRRCINLKILCAASDLGGNRRTLQPLYPAIANINSRRSCVHWRSMTPRWFCLLTEKPVKVIEMRPARHQSRNVNIPCISSHSRSRWQPTVDTPIVRCSRNMLQMHFGDSSKTAVWFPAVLTIDVLLALLWVVAETRCQD